MPKRSYVACPECATRMRCFDRDDDDERRFYYCPECANRVTFMVPRNGIGRDWPKSVFAAAVDAGVFTRDGSLVR